MHEIKLRLNLSATKLHRYYQGNAKNVVTQSLDGRIVQFPINILKPFIKHSGVSGVFALYYDNSGKFTDIKKISELGQVKPQK